MVPQLASGSGNGFADSWLSLSVALAALIAVIGAKRARRARGERSERDASPCPHHAAGVSEVMPSEPPPA
jgi:hypothetical protein